MDILKEAGSEAIEVISKCLNECVMLCNISTDRKNAIFFKKKKKILKTTIQSPAFNYAKHSHESSYKSFTETIICSEYK